MMASAPGSHFNKRLVAKVEAQVMSNNKKAERRGWSNTSVSVFGINKYKETCVPIKDCLCIEYDSQMKERKNLVELVYADSPTAQSCGRTGGTHNTPFSCMR